MFKELKFITELFKLNLASAMEYRVSFLIQIFGMFLNNGIYFLFWFIFFNQFGDVRGYQFSDMYLLYATVAMSFGINQVFAGNTHFFLAGLIANGRLDYYLVFPRNLLSHVIFSRLHIYALGDIIFSLMVFPFSGYFTLKGSLLFLLVTICAGSIMAAFGIITGSLAFFIGNAEYSSQQAFNALMTFGLYPHTLFSGGAKIILFTLIPAGFIGAIPVEIVKGNVAQWLPILLLAVAGFWAAALAVFNIGLRRYESGSAINLNV